MFQKMLNTENTPVVLIRYLNNFVLTAEGKEEGREGQINGGKKEEKGK